MKTMTMRLFTLCLFVVSTLAYACGDNSNSIVQGPFKDSSFENGLICFQKSLDKRDVEFFQSYSTSQGEVNNKVDTFDYADAPAELMTVFFAKISGKKNVVVLLRWNVNYENDGIRYPYHYEVRLYQSNDSSGYRLNLDSDKDPYLSGYQTISNGQTINYPLDNAQKIKRYLRMKYGM